MGSLRGNLTSIMYTSAIHVAAKFGHFKICKWILEIVTDQNPTDETGSTPLNEAYKNEHFDICRLIINQRENSSISEPSGKRQKIQQ